MANCCSCDRPLLRLKLDPFVLDRRLAFIESNLNLLNESRFRRAQTLTWLPPGTARPTCQLSERFSIPAGSQVPRLPTQLVAFGVSEAWLAMQARRPLSRRLRSGHPHLGNTQSPRVLSRPARWFTPALVNSGLLINTRAGPIARRAREICRLTQ